MFVVLWDFITACLEPAKVYFPWRAHTNMALWRLGKLSPAERAAHIHGPSPLLSTRWTEEREPK